MTLQAHPSLLQLLAIAAITQVRRRPYLSISVVAHALLLALLYYFGSYQPQLREQEAEVASSLRATHVASTAKRLQDLQTIKRLLEKSADRVDERPEPSPDPAGTPETPEEIVERARELSREIETLDQEIRAEELAELMGDPEPAPAPPPESRVADTPPQQSDAGANDTQTPITAERAASEVAELEAKARTTLARRQQRLEAKANGVPVASLGSGAGEQGAGGTPAPPNAQGESTDTSVRAEIAEFIEAGRRSEEATRSQRYFSGIDFFDRGASAIPPVDATSLVLGRGRMLGAGGEYANRVYLNSWYIIGPFPGRHAGDLFDNPSYPPERAVLLDAVYFGKDKRLLKWRYVTAQNYPLVPPDSVEDSVYYGYTEVLVDQDCDLTAWIGVDDDVQIYLNDRLVWKGGNVNKQTYFNAVFDPDTTYLRDYNRTEGKRVLHFNKGRNRIFFKLSNGPNDGFLSFVLTR
jgi:hypothetical protein